jgi:hypothetical protein
VFLVLLEIKIRIEERLMLAEFPDEYPRYRQRVPRLVPGLRLVSRTGRSARKPRHPRARGRFSVRTELRAGCKQPCT